MYECPECHGHFKGKQGISTHMTRAHQKSAKEVIQSNALVPVTRAVEGKKKVLRKKVDVIHLRCKICPTCGTNIEIIENAMAMQERGLR